MVRLLFQPQGIFKREANFDHTTAGLAGDNRKPCLTSLKFTIFDINTLPFFVLVQDTPWRQPGSTNVMQIPQVREGLAIDIEMQQNEQREGLRRDTGSDDGARMTTLQALFGFTPEQMRQIKELPITTSWCRYLENSFQPLLTERYTNLWSTIGFPPPHTISHCWTFFHAVSHAVTNLDDAAYSIKEVWRSVKVKEEHGYLITPAGVPDECLIAVFAVLCWGSMILQPQLAWSDSATAPCLSIRQLPVDNHGLKMDFVNRPIPSVFRSFQKALVRRYPTRKPMVCESTVLYASTINYHSLQTIGKVSLKWVDNLSCHLNFDLRTRTLSVFRFPSFCAVATIAGDRCVLMEELVQALFSTDNEDTRELECSSQLSQEVLMSYRLLFGQSRAARRLGKVLLKKMEVEDDYDQLLDCLCTKPHKDVAKNLPQTFWPASCRDFDNTFQEVDSYSSLDDFPMLGSRLVAIQEFNLRQQPSKLRDLWRDRRNPLQWYTFWAVLVVGGLSIILAILQLVAAIVAVVRG